MIYHITGINPEPWVAPQVNLGRRNGKMFAQFYTSDTLKTYQEAVKEEIVLQNGDLFKFSKGLPLRVKFFLWRQLDASESEGRATRRQVADATNCQKALEDALQGVLYHNDQANIRVETFIVNQATYVTPHIAIEIRALANYDYHDVPVIPEYPKVLLGNNIRDNPGDPF